MPAITNVFIITCQNMVWVILTSLFRQWEKGSRLQKEYLSINDFFFGQFFFSDNNVNKLLLKLSDYSLQTKENTLIKYFLNERPYKTLYEWQSNNCMETKYVYSFSNLCQRPSRSISYRKITMDYSGTF